MMYNFEDGKGPVKAHKHANGGGWVADTAYVADTVFVGPSAKVSGNARVYDKAMVSGNAMVFNNAKVYGNASVSGNARISGNAWVSKTPPHVVRTDGYDFIVVPCSDGKNRVIAGCRYFTFKEAKEHWKATRGGTELGEETMDILEYLKKRV